MPSFAFVGALLILPEGPRPLTLRIQGDTIISVGGAPQPGDTVIDLTGYIIFPGLINSLDRLDESTFTPFKMRSQYDNLREWREDFREQAHSEEFRHALQASPPDRIFIGALANLLNGVTSVMHTGQASGPLASLRKLPVNLIACWGWSPPVYENSNLRKSFAQTDPACPWIIPLAEGTDGTGTQEFRHLEEAQCLGANTVLVSALDIGPDEINTIQEVGTSIIWTPGANLHILGETFVHKTLGNRTSIGTGSRLAGSRGLLSELKLARHHSQLPGGQVVKMVTDQSARILRQADRIGVLAQGAQADLVILQNRGDDPYELLISSERSEIDVVMVRGKPAIGARSSLRLFDSMGQGAKSVSLDGTPYLVARDIWRRYSRIRLTITGLLSI